MKVCAKIIAALLILLILILLSLRIPYVQNKLAQFATSKLSKQLTTTVSIDKININFTDNANIKGIYIEDLNQDTLLYSGELDIDIAFFQLFKKKIELEAISLDGAVIKLKQDADEAFNFQFIIDAFASQDTITQPTESTFTIDVDAATILRSRVHVDLIASNINVTVKEISTVIDVFDLDNQIIDLKNLHLDGLDVALINIPTTTQDVVENPDLQQQSTAFPLSSLPFALSCRDFTLKDGHILMKDKGASKKDYFDASYIDIQDFNAEIQNLKTNSEGLVANLQSASLKLSDDVIIQKLESELTFNDQQLFLENTLVQTNKSSFDLNTKVSYDHFIDLTNLNSSLAYDLKIKKSNLHISEINYFAPEVLADPTFKDIQKKSLLLEGVIKGTMSKAKLQNVAASIENSFIKLTGTVTNFMDTELVSVKNLEINAEANYQEYMPFISDVKLRSQMSEIGDFKLLSKLNGSLKEMKFEMLELRTDAILAADLSGTIKNILDVEKLQYDLSINRIITGNKDAEIFLDTLSTIFAKFDTLEYVGKLRGTKYKADLTGGFSTSLGDIMTNFIIEFNQDFTNATYEGLLGFDKFELGDLIDNDSLETITMQARIEGSGLDLETIDTKIEAVIDQVIFNQYDYKNLVIDGRVHGLEFIGEANIDDENIRFQFDGRVDMNDSIPVLAFDFVLDTLNLGKLNIAEEKFQAKFKIDANFKGITPDDAEGTLTIYNLNLTKTDKKYQTDSITMEAKTENGNRGIFINSDFLEANVQGDFQLALLSDVILDFMDQYFPLKTFLGPTDEEDNILNTQEKKEVRNDKIDATIRVHNVVEIASFFDIPITSMDSTYLLFSLNAPENLTNFEFYMPSINYDGYFIDSIYATAENSIDRLTGKLSIDSISITEAISISGFRADALFSEKKARIRAKILDGDENLNLSIGTEITSTVGQVFELVISDTFALNGKNWNVSQDSAILISGNQLTIPKIQVKNGVESMMIRGSNDFIKLVFDRFDVNNFTNLVNVDSLDVGGIMNGDLQVGLETDIPIVGDLVINDIRFNEFDIGTLDLDATKYGDDVVVALKLIGEEIQMQSNMNYSISNGDIQGAVDIDRINLKPFEPFVLEYASNLDGFLSGNLTVEGTVDDPSLLGKIQMTNVEAFIKALATKYTISDGILDVSDGQIEPKLTLIDNAQRKAYVTGKVTHDYFQNIEFNLLFKTQEFTFLNSKQSKKELFYGKFVGKVDARITGTPDLPVISANVNALNGTDMTVQLLNSEAVLSQEKYIIFFDGSKVSSREEIDSLANLAYILENSIDINLNLKASPEALFHVIVDPITGDNLNIRGFTDLQVSMPNRGNLSIIGEYTVTEGSYRVSYENTLKRIFQLDPGSQIIFQGDPTNARLDMRALYNTKANTYTLLETVGAGLSNDGSGSNRSEVQVVLNVDGTLAKPELTFDIQIPTTSTSPVANSLSSALSTLRQNETQLLEQVFSLILFNSFTGGSSGGNISSVGSSQAINSVGNLINGQLGKLAGKAQGLEIDFQLDQYKDVTKDSDANVTEFGLGLQQRLLDDRLIISAGGNANLETGQSTTNNFSSFAGDFVIQYLLTEGGKYRVKVFQKTDYNALNNDNIWKTGVGISYKAKYGRVAPKPKKKKDESSN